MSDSLFRRLAAGACGLVCAAGPAAAADDGSLTYRGLTLYGTFDIGLAYLTHGAPLSAYFPPGLPFLIQKFSDQPILSVAPNGLSQSKLGLAGDEQVAGGARFVFRLETGFQPTSGALTDGPKSIVLADGRPLAQQTTNGDTARAGQPLQGAAYAGLATTRFGVLTFGRQNGLLLDDLILYDPQAQSYAFSPIGYSGVAGGAGDTEDTRLGQALKYVLDRGVLHLGLLRQFGGAGGFPGGADEADVGLRAGGLSIDAAYSRLYDAVAVSSLTAAQTAVRPGALAATVSDNTSYSVQGRYAFRSAKLYAGYEYVDYADPAHPLPAGVTDIGGYALGVVNNTAFRTHKIVQVYWLGLRYALTRRLDLTGAYYHYQQGSYQGDGCADASAPSCAGGLNVVSLVADWRLSRHFDTYAGVTTSDVKGGLASGYLNTAVVASMTGVRFSF